MEPEQALIFLTHFENDRVRRHFQRLQSECSGLLDSFMCFHDASDGIAPDLDLSADLRVNLNDGRRVLHSRFNQMRDRNIRIVPGYTDLCYMPALVAPQLVRYNYIWVVEYDVDYAGNWRHLFANLIHSRADLLATSILSRRETQNWLHWNWFVPPPQVSAERHIRAFLPIVRFSRRLFETYIAVINRDDWTGHTEAVIPSFAAQHGFDVVDIGGQGAFTPPTLLGKHYRSVITPNGDLYPGTIVYRPVEHVAYFHESPSNFVERGYLYHPVKVKHDT